MTIRLAERVDKLKPSASIAARKKVTELQSAGHHIIDFTIGEPDFSTPDHIIQAAVSAMRNGETHYTPTAGTLVLRSAICEKLLRENKLVYRPENVVVGCGAKQIIFEAFAATLDRGDEVIVPAPYWVSYPDIVELNNGTAVIVPCDESVAFKLTPQALEAAITPRTRWVILNSPNNPTGAVYSESELKQLVAVLNRHKHVWLMTDDIYEHLIYAPEGQVNCVNIDPSIAGRTLIVNGFSKTYAMTGWRIGYAVGPTELIEPIVKLLGQGTTCANSISQAAAVAALNGDQSQVLEMNKLYRKRRDLMVSLLHGTLGMCVSAPAGAFYLYPSVAGLIGRKTNTEQVLRTDLDVSLYLLEAANVAVLDGTAYGLSPYLRLSFATSLDAIEEGCKRIRSACESLIS